MSDNKKYYWLKLKNDFFDQKEIKMLRRLAGGDTYTVIYLKMLLISLENEGKIYFDSVADNMIEEIALDIDEDVENVQVAFSYLIQKGLIVEGADEDVEMMKIGEMIGSESASARRVRKHRRRKALQSNNYVTDVKRLGNTEIEKEIEKDIDKDILSSSGEHDQPIPYEEVINYLNEQADKSYKHTTKKTRDLIKARTNEGFTKEDFKTVIDIKSKDWLKDQKMSKYLRPETLFSNKFESYLNEQPKGFKGSKDISTNKGWLEARYE